MHADCYGKASMQQISFANALLHTEAGLEMPGVSLYKDANSMFNFELNNAYIKLLMSNSSTLPSRYAF
jgi:hypothetical protein